MRHDGDEWQEANGCLGDLSNDQSHLKVTCLVFLPRDIEMQEWNATFAWWVSTFWHFHTLFFVAFSYPHVLVPLPFHTRLSRPQFYDSKQIRGEKQRYLLSFQSYSELIFHKFFFFFFFLQRAQMEFDILYLMGEISSAFILCEESHDTLEFPWEWTGHGKVRVRAN